MVGVNDGSVDGRDSQEAVEDGNERTTGEKSKEKERSRERSGEGVREE